MTVTIQPRQHPIPPPNHPRQFRAIGVVYGRYYPSEAASQRGVLVTEDGSMVETVLLGRVFSVVKNHVDLDDSHFWIVYPRLRDKDDHLHFQVMGIWEPATLGTGSIDVTQPDSLAAPDKDRAYFSVRGEVVFVSSAKETVIVKVRQSPRPHSKRPRFFKVKVHGRLKNADGSICDRPLRHFWNLQLTLQKNQLILEQSTDLGLNQRRPMKKQQPSPKPGKPIRPSNGDRPLKRLPKLRKAGKT